MGHYDDQYEADYAEQRAAKRRAQMRAYAEANEAVKKLEKLATKNPDTFGLRPVARAARGRLQLWVYDNNLEAEGDSS